MPAIKFEEAFDMAYQRAVKRLAAERKVVKGPISLNKNASKIYISGLLSPGHLAIRPEFRAFEVKMASPPSCDPKKSRTGP